MDILPARPFEVYLASLFAKPSHLIKLMAIVYLSQAPDYIMPHECKGQSINNRWVATHDKRVVEFDVNPTRKWDRNAEEKHKQKPWRKARKVRRSNL